MKERAMTQLVHISKTAWEVLEADGIPVKTGRERADLGADGRVGLTKEAATRLMESINARCQRRAAHG